MVQDWLDVAQYSVSALSTDAQLGRTWLMQMGRAADKYGLSIQYCMSFCRHILQSIEIPAVVRMLRYHLCPCCVVNVIAACVVTVCMYRAFEQQVQFLSFTCASLRFARMRRPPPNDACVPREHQQVATQLVWKCCIFLQTQARASDDYHPGNDQWILGVSGLLAYSVGLSPSKDGFW